MISSARVLENGRERHTAEKIVSCRHVGDGDAVLTACSDELIDSPLITGVCLLEDLSPGSSVSRCNVDED